MKQVMRLFVNPNHIAWQISESSLNRRFVVLAWPPKLKVMAVFTLHHITPFILSAVALG